MDFESKHIETDDKVKLKNESKNNRDLLMEEMPFTKTLKRGSGFTKEVKSLQKIVGAISDGKFGPATERLVKKWQSNNGLVSDGIVGKNSRKILNNSRNNNNSNTTKNNISKSSNENIISKPLRKKTYTERISSNKNNSVIDKIPSSEINKMNSKEKENFNKYTAFIEKIKLKLSGINLKDFFSGNIKTNLQETYKKITDELNYVNKYVKNSLIDYKSDKSTGKADKSGNYTPPLLETIKGGTGDCEDIVGVVRGVLVESGFPEKSLKVAYGKSGRSGVAHMVLKVELPDGKSKKLDITNNYFKEVFSMTDGYYYHNGKTIKRNPNVKGKYDGLFDYV